MTQKRLAEDLTFCYFCVKTKVKKAWIFPDSLKLKYLYRFARSYSESYRIRGSRLKNQPQIIKTVILKIEIQCKPYRKLLRIDIFSVAETPQRINPYKFKNILNSEARFHVGATVETAKIRSTTCL
jgi:hypothetical protein